MDSLNEQNQKNKPGGQCLEQTDSLELIRHVSDLGPMCELSNTT